MQNLKILNRKETKPILELMKKQWDIDAKLDYAFLMNNKGKVFLSNKEAFNLDFKKIRINSMGLYFAEVKGDEIRLSIEGSQLIGAKAKKNIIELTDSEARKWLKGEDLDKACKGEGFLIIKHDKDFLGTGRYKEGRILNFVPKTRRLNVSD